MNVNNQRETKRDDFFDFVFNLTANEEAFYASLIGIALAQNLTISEQNDLGNFFMLIAQELLTMSAHNQLVETRNQKRGQQYQPQDHH